MNTVLTIGCVALGGDSDARRLQRGAAMRAAAILTPIAITGAVAGGLLATPADHATEIAVVLLSGTATGSDNRRDYHGRRRRELYRHIRRDRPFDRLAQRLGSRHARQRTLGQPVQHRGGLRTTTSSAGRSSSSPTGSESIGAESKTHSMSGSETARLGSPNRYPPRRAGACRRSPSTRRRGRRRR